MPSYIDNDRVFRNNIQHGPVLPRLFIFLLVISMSSAILAQTSRDAREQLSGTANEIKAASKRQKKIAEQTVKLERELKELQHETIALARDTDGQEQELSAFEDKLTILEEQKKQKNDNFAGRKAELSTLVSAMVRLRQLPPEAVIAMPGKLDETLAAARALNIVTHAIEEDSDSLKLQLRELDDLEDKIKKNSEVIVSRKSSLEEKRARLASKIKERTKLEDELNDEDEKEQEHIEQLNAKSHNLQDLINALGKQQESHQEKEVKAGVPKKDEDNDEGNEVRSFSGAKGKIRMPAAGKIVRHYGSGGQETAFSRGITLETRENANVVAPFDGEVVYAGSFRDYGRIVIIRHSDDYHTLLSGMEHINCKLGQLLMEGEPIGSMGQAHDGRRLYIEVRHNSKPIDPGSWLKGA